MTIPASPPRRYTASRQLIAGDDFNNLSDHIYGFQSVNAVGTTQGTANLITAANVEILAGALSVNNGGVILPVAIPGQNISLLNNSANTTNVYPQANGDVIAKNTTQYQAANTPVALATLTSYDFFCTKKGFWQATKTTGAP
jgi:hypothetical protein